MSRSSKILVFGPLVGAALAAGSGYVFGAQAETILIVLCLAAVVYVWLRAVNASQSSSPEAEAAAPSGTLLPQPTEQARSLKPLAVLDALPIGVLVVDSNQQVIAANRMIRDTFALPEDPGYPVETLRAQRLLRAVEDVQRSGDPTDFEMTLSRRADLALHVHVQRIEGDATSDTRVILSVEDVTKARLADELHRDFVANASHELKTPLAVISGLIDTLQGPAKNDPAGTERFLERLASQTQRMTRLITDLMSLNRIELNERVMPQIPYDVTGMVAEAVDALRPAAEAAQVTLSMHPNDFETTVLADHEELGQLFGNLIDNAIKYGGSGGTVDVQIQNDAARAEIGVSVSDTGPGIAREHLPRLTERFYRVDVGRSREQGGTGLGLAICKHIANRHRGRIEIESTLGTGTTFTVWLPRFSSEDVVENRTGSS